MINFIRIKVYIALMYLSLINSSNDVFKANGGILDVLGGLLDAGMAHQGWDGFDFDTGLDEAGGEGSSARVRAGAFDAGLFVENGE